MENVHKILDQKAVRITPMRQLLLEYFIQEDVILGLSELERYFRNLTELRYIVP